MSSFIMAFLKSVSLFKNLPESKTLQTCSHFRVSPTKTICQTYLSLPTGLAPCHLLEFCSTLKLLTVSY